jgi:ATP-dependent exoDNAse (exonuclease V) alpha subunit
MEHTHETIFLTGRAGTGKSTLLKHFIKTTKKEVAVLAPTGVAALNIEGMTIHRFFGFSTTVTVMEAKKKAKKAEKAGLAGMYSFFDTIIIDEISMVRADLLDCIDIFLKTLLDNSKPFGGKQMIFIGDLYQLPPIVQVSEKEHFGSVYPSPYFFDSHVMQEIHDMYYCELEKVYRQSDNTFIALLNAFRNRTF